MDGLNEEFETFEGHFNLGDALYKQGKYEEALKAYQNAMPLTESDKQRARIFHNVGNTFIKDQKIQEGELRLIKILLDLTRMIMKQSIIYRMP